MKCSALTNEELITSLKQLVVHEREAIADVVEHLAEVDARRLYISAACSSLSAYCVEVLGYSQFAAAHRVTAARLVRAYPMILPMLRSGDLNMSTLRTLAPVLTASNHYERLKAAVGRTRNELERMVAGWAPKPDVPTRIAPVSDTRAVLLEYMHAAPVPQSVALPSQSSLEAASSPSLQPSFEAASPSVDAPPPSRPAPLPKPLTPERYSIQVTVDRETYEDLMRLRDHLRHTIPDGDVAKILARAVKDLRTSVEARKFGKRKAGKVKNEQLTAEKAKTEKLTAEVRHSTSERSRAEKLTSAARPSASGARQPELFAEPTIEDDIHMPRAPGRATRREVAERDQYRCCYVSDNGRQCSATGWLEYDHDLDWALNGPTWAENMQLLCRAHHRAKHRDDYCAR